MSENLIKPIFIKCSETEVLLRRSTIKNDPINLATVTSIHKIVYRLHPENPGAPGILFRGPEIKWAYPDEATRDADLERIANNEF